MEFRSGTTLACSSNGGSPTMLDMPDAVLEDILLRCGPANTRTGICCLPLVCKRFYSVLQDLQYARLWGTVAPLSCLSQHDVKLPPERWWSLQRWLQLRKSAIRILHIKRQHLNGKRPRLLRANLLGALMVPSLTELLIDLPGVNLRTTNELAAPLSVITGLKRLQLSLRSCKNDWKWLRKLQRLTSLQLDGFEPFDFHVLDHSTMLEEVSIRLDHEADVSPLAGLPVLKRLTLPAPRLYDRFEEEELAEEVAEKLAEQWESISGLTALKELVLSQWGEFDPEDSTFSPLPSDETLSRLTTLTSLKLHVSEEAPADESIQPSITRLSLLAHLHVWSSPESAMTLPPGFGGLSELTSLTFRTVRFCDGAPLQGGLHALRVLEVGGCTGPLPIACALPALQRMSIAEIGHLELLDSFVSALESQPGTRCEIVQSQHQGCWHKLCLTDDLLPPMVFELPRLRSVAIAINLDNYKGVYWDDDEDRLPKMPLLFLEELDLQNCCMEELPAVLGAASRLRQLRISDLHGGPISLEPDDLETLSSMSSLTFLSFAQPHRRRTEFDPKAPLLLTSHWSTDSLRNLCCILWELRARSLTVVLYEPSNVMVPLAVAASFPADALGRRALTRAAVADRFPDAAPKPADDPRRRWDPEERQQWAWLFELFPQRNSHDVAEVDGAAAMSAAVPAHVTSWLQLQADVKGRPYEDWSDEYW